MRTTILQFALLALTTSIQAASQIALFTDDNCKDSYTGLDGPNGYPNGTCTDMRRSGEYGSLQVVGLDPGCAVTIYIDDPDTTVCGGFQEEIQLGQCWNSTFAYYSIDMCDAPGSSITPTPSSSSEDSDSHSLATGTLVGAILGSLAGGALLLGFALWVLARKKRARKACLARDAAEAGYSENGGGYAAANRAEVETNPYRSEMDGSYQRHEMEQGKVVYKHEVATPPVELGGWEVRRDGDRDQGRARQATN